MEIGGALSHAQADRVDSVARQNSPATEKTTELPIRKSEFRPTQRELAEIGRAHV